MIVDLFGPPCSGKTVFAMRLAARLRQLGFDVDLRVSSRGYETGGSYEAIVENTRKPRFATLYRLGRPALEFASDAARPNGQWKNAAEAQPLLRLAETGLTIRTFRFRRYVKRLARLWRAAETSDAVTIFDQGYVQALCSALLMHPSASEAEIADAFRSLPHADVLVRVEAPLDLIEERLRRRMSRLDPVARLLEVTMGISLANTRDHVAAIDRLSGLLTDHGNAVHVVRSDDTASLEACVVEIAAARNDLAENRASHAAWQNGGPKI